MKKEEPDYKKQLLSKISKFNKNQTLILLGAAAIIEQETQIKLSSK